MPMAGLLSNYLNQFGNITLLNAFFILEAILGYLHEFTMVTEMNMGLPFTC